MNGIEAQVKAAMEAVVEHLKQDLKTLRSGRANPSMLDKVQVELYGSAMPIKNIAHVTASGTQQIIVTPFDHTSLHAIAKGIEAANLGINPTVDGKLIRINIPPMDESIRKQIAKQCKELGEKAKIALREVRRRFNEVVRKLKTTGEMPEDVMKKQEKKIQELTDLFCKNADAACTEKEKEIMTV